MKVSQSAAEILARMTQEARSSAAARTPVVPVVASRNDRSGMGELLADTVGKFGQLVYL